MSSPNSQESPQANMLLDHPRLLLTDGGLLAGASGRLCFYSVLVFLGGLGAWGSLISAFQIPTMPAILVASGIPFSLFAVWRQVDTRKRWWSVSLVGWIIWGIMMVFLFDDVLRGGVRVLNAMLKSYSIKLNYDLPVVTLPTSAGVRVGTPESTCTTFFIMAFFPFCWEMAYMMARKRSFLGPFAITGVLLVLPMGFSILPANWAFGTLMLFWAVLLLIAPSLGGRERASGRIGLHKGYKASGAASARPATLLLLPVLALCMFAIVKADPPETYTRPKLANELRAAIQDGFGATAYMRGGQSNSNRNVQLDQLGNRSYSGETMLRVRFDWNNLIKARPVSPPANSEKEYLKCFVGSEYTGSTWERLSDEARQELSGLELSFYPQQQIAKYRELMFYPGYDMRPNYLLTVENVGANPRCVYVPSAMASGDLIMDEFNMEYVDDSFVKSSNFLTGTRSYKVQGVGEPPSPMYYAGRMYYCLTNQFDETGEGGKVIYDTDGNKHVFPPWGERVDPESLDDSLVYAIKSQLKERGLGGPNAYDLWNIEDDFVGVLDEGQQTFARSVEDYNAFVYEHYTQVPEELEGFLDDFIQAYNLYPNMFSDSGSANSELYYAVQICSAFQKYFTYSLEPPTTPEGMDFVEYFLRESHEGFCVHFASAAVMLLRAAGYPARYAEGYVVPSSQEGWVDVPDYNAHAWVEVYYGGIGWVPLEVTPPSTDNPAVYYNATMPEEPEQYITTPVPEEDIPYIPPRRLSDDELSDRLNLTMRPRASQSPEPNGSGSHGGYSPEDDPSFWPVVLGSIGLVLALIGGFLLIRNLRRRKRTISLTQADRNQAALSAYAWLLKLYQWELLCGARHEPPERWLELAEKARYGPSQLSAEELAELTGDGERLTVKLRRQLPKMAKLRCWLSGLI